MTMIKGERGPLYDAAGSGGSGARKPEQNQLFPATQEATIYEGDVLKGRYDLIEILADGRENGQGIVARARRLEDGKEVVVKQYSEADSGSWDDIEAGEIGAAREISFLRRANKDNVGGVPYLVEYGVTGDLIKQPVAVFESIPGKTVEDVVLDSDYTPSVEEVKKVVGLLENPLNYAHTFSVQPIVHRDINPKNIMVNGDGAILIDWATSKATSGKTNLGTQFVTLYYTAPEILEGRAFDGRADIYGLGKVLNYMLVGDDLFSASDGKPSVDDFEYLNIPNGLPKVLERATQENPEHRYRTAREFYDALNGGLEKITGRSSVPEQELETRGVVAEVGENSVSFGGRVVDNDDGTLSIVGGIVGPIIIKRGKDVHEDVGNLRNYLERMGLTDEEKAEIKDAYLQYLSKEHPILKCVANGDQTIQEVYEGVKAGKSPVRKLVWGLIRGLGEDFVSPGDPFCTNLRGAFSNYKQARKAYKEKVGKLEKVVSGAEKALGGWTENLKGTAIGYFSLGLSSILIFSPMDNFGSYLLTGVSSALLGAKAGSIIQRSSNRRDVKKKLGEIGSFMEPPKSSKDLEEKAREGDVSLTRGENGAIFSRSCLVGVAGGVSLGALAEILSPGLGAYLLTGGLAMGMGNNYSLTKSALKQKRLDAGLPANPGKPEMHVVGEYRIPDSPDRLKEVLSQNNLRKRFGRSFVSPDGNVEVSYREYNSYKNVNAVIRNLFMRKKEYTVYTNVKVRAPKREMAERVLSIIESLKIEPLASLKKFQEDQELK